MLGRYLVDLLKRLRRHRQERPYQTKSEGLPVAHMAVQKFLELQAQ